MGNARILVVDDDQALVHLLKENLELEGYQVFVGYDGAMAMQLTAARRPDLIIMDINMPFSNGLDVLTHLRQDSATNSIPVIFMTGIQSKNLYPTIDRHQRVSYMKKPLDLDQLNSLVRQFLANYPVAPEKAPQLPTASVPVTPSTVAPSQVSNEGLGVEDLPLIDETLEMDE